MAVLTLYRLCLQKTASLLGRSYWERRHPNPFSTLPTHIVDNLIAYVIDLASLVGYRHNELDLLLESGRAEHFLVSKLDLTRRDDLILTIRSLGSCRNLRSLRLTGGDCEEFASPDIEELFGVLTKLEDVHCSIPFDLKALRKCTKLRSIRLHFFPKQPLCDFLGVSGKDIQPHRSLKVFTICAKRMYSSASYKDLAEILMHCPELQSLGCFESSHAIVYSHTLSMEKGRDPPVYQLRKCIFHQGAALKLPEVGQEMPNSMGCLLPLSVRYVVASCPLLEEVVITVPMRHCRDVIDSLVTLENLSHLEIDLNDGECYDFRPGILYLLRRIGSGLKHLSLNRLDNVELDSIFRSCPRLESLKMDCDRVVARWVHACADLHRLRRLAFFVKYGSSDCESVRQMLSRCDNVEELFLKNVEFLNDSLLSSVLGTNPMQRLRVVSLSDCFLSTEGLRKFLLTTAPILEKISVESNRLPDGAAEHLVSLLAPRAIWYESYDDIILTDEFFNRKYEDC